MRETTQNFLVGLTAIVALLGIAFLLMQFGEFEQFFDPRYSVTIRTDHAAGIRPGSVAEYSGVPVGVVDDITLNTSSDAVFPVSIMVLVDPRYSLPAQVEPYSVTSLFGGSSTLELQIPPGTVVKDSQFLPKDDTASITSEVRFQIIEQIASELDARMQPVLDSLAAFKELSETYTSVGENINEFLAPDGPGGERPDWRRVVNDFTAILQEVDEALQLAQEWLGDEQLKADVSGAVGNANDLIHRASDTLDRFTRLADDLETNAEEIVKGLLPITDEVATTLEEVRRLTRSASQGDGTMAQLMNNPDLYNSLEDAAVRLERTLTEIQLYIQKVKAEGLDIDF